MLVSIHLFEHRDFHHRVLVSRVGAGAETIVFCVASEAGVCACSCSQAGREYHSRLADATVSVRDKMLCSNSIEELRSFRHPVRIVADTANTSRPDPAPRPIQVAVEDNSELGGR